MTKQSGTSESTETKELPDYINTAQEFLVNAGIGMAAPHIQGSDSAIAGQNVDQLKAAELARKSSTGAFNTDYSTAIADMGDNSNYAEDLQQYMNPYLEQVGRNTLNEMDRDKRAADASIGARNASAVAFGGSGPALERAQLNRAHGENVASTMANLNSAAYQDAANRLQTDKQLELQALISADGAANNTFNRQQSSLDTLLNIGNQNQSYDQSVIDLPWTSYNRAQNVINGANVETQSTTSKPVYDSPLGSLLGMTGLFS